MCNVHLRMLADEVHFLVHCLDAYYVCSCVVCQLNLMAAADTLCAPVEITHVYRTSHLACDSMETCLPSLDRLTCTFRCECKVNDLLRLHLLDDAESDVATSFSVYRDSSHLAEKPSERAPEKLSLDHAVRLSADRCIIKVRYHEIPD